MPGWCTRSGTLVLLLRFSLDACSEQLGTRLHRLEGSWPTVTDTLIQALDLALGDLADLDLFRGPTGEWLLDKDLCSLVA